MKHKYLVAGAAFMAFMFVLGTFLIPQMGSGQARSETVDFVIESPHNYPNNFDEYYGVTYPGAEWMQVYFEMYYTERRYDYIYIEDDAGNIYGSYTGYKKRVWSAQVPGDTLWIHLVSDSSVTKYGFKVTKVAYEAGTEPPPTPPLDDIDPVVAITSPTGGTVADTVTVAISATDNVGVENILLSIDGGAYFSTGPTYNWDTTLVDDGDHTLRAKAVDAAGNEGFSSIVTVDVDNIQEPPPAQDGDEHFFGAVAGTEVDWYEIFAYPGSIDVSISWVGSYDIDAYICETQSTSVYLARGYTTNNPEVCSYTVPTTYPDGHTYYIGVKMYTSTAPSTNYDCHVLWETSYEPPPPPPPPTGNRWAVVAGVSDYKAISDLSYCDEDATDWYNYLIGLGYGVSNIRVLGDTHTSNYPAYYAVATEYNTKAALQWLADNTGTGDVVNFITSGHGSGDGNGMAFLCSWDCSSGESGQDGNFYDYELDDSIQAIAGGGALVHVFIDHCYSGGMGPELMAIANAGNVYLTTTCSDDGYGYDDGAHQNGMWTYWFLEAGLIGQFGSSASTTMEECFDWAAANYPRGGDDAPEEYDGSPGTGFLL